MFQVTQSQPRMLGCKAPEPLSCSRQGRSISDSARRKAPCPTFGRISGQNRDLSRCMRTMRKDIPIYCLKLHSPPPLAERHSCFIS